MATYSSRIIHDDSMEMLCGIIREIIAGRPAVKYGIIPAVLLDVWEQPARNRWGRACGAMTVAKARTWT
ncbi:unnamed protein product [Heligmosomoides polygyrus]|uniref:DUF4255 domain-containing protein n=1 Tax=Heligmosomoides polygyrus TaxID=6339 RepID=A0A183FMV6_HELPZ|nr:unnamed protein product [Heligmosomoides polygyrus]